MVAFDNEIILSGKLFIEIKLMMSLNLENDINSDFILRKNIDRPIEPSSKDINILYSLSYVKKLNADNSRKNRRTPSSVTKKFASKNSITNIKI